MSYINKINQLFRDQGIDPLVQDEQAPANYVEMNPAPAVEQPAPVSSAPAEQPYDSAAALDKATQAAQEAIAQIKSRRGVSNLGQGILSRFNGNRVAENDARFDKQEAQALDNTLGAFSRRDTAINNQNQRNRQATTWAREDAKYARESEDMKAQRDPNSQMSQVARDTLNEMLTRNGINSPLKGNETYEQVVKLQPWLKDQVDQKLRADQITATKDLREATLNASIANNQANRDQRDEFNSTAGVKAGDEAYGKYRTKDLPTAINFAKADDLALDRMAELITSKKFTPEDAVTMAAAWQQSGQNPSLFGTLIAKNALSPGAQEFASLISQMAPRQRPPGSGATSDFDLKQFITALVVVPQVLKL